MADLGDALDAAVGNISSTAAILEIVFDQFQRSAVATESLVETHGVKNAWVQIWLTDAEQLALETAVSGMLRAADTLKEAHNG